MGSFEGFQRTSNANDYVEFDTFGATSAASDSYAFGASLNGMTYACTGQNPAAAWRTMTTSHGLFEIAWNTSGVCSYVEAWNVSDIATY